MTASQNRSDTVLERARVREVTGVFNSREALDATANELLLMGFDRADVDVVASLDDIHKRLDVPYVAAEELADVPQVPRRPFIAGEDVTVFKVVVAGALGAIAAGATVLLMFFSGARARRPAWPPRRGYSGRRCRFPAGSTDFRARRGAGARQPHGYARPHIYGFAFGHPRRRPSRKIS